MVIYFTHSSKPSIFHLINVRSNLKYYIENCIILFSGCVLFNLGICVYNSFNQFLNEGHLDCFHSFAIRKWLL